MPQESYENLAFTLVLPLLSVVPKLPCPVEKPTTFVLVPDVPDIGEFVEFRSNFRGPFDFNEPLMYRY